MNTTRKTLFSKRIKKVIALFCALMLVLTTTPPYAVLAQDPHSEPVPVKVRTGPTSVTIFKPSFDLPETPLDEDVAGARIFSEALRPMRNKPAAQDENRELRLALTAFKAKNNPEDVSDLEAFIKTHPQSRWRPALELNMGQLRFQTGYFSDALSLYKSAWENSKDEKDREQANLASQALSELMLLSARLGRKDELENYIRESKGRVLQGSIEEKVDTAHIGLAYMKNNPEIAYKCGPFALNSILKVLGKVEGRHPILEQAPSTHKGTNMLQLKNWAKQCGLNLQLARRATGAPLVVPAVVHWKVGHFGAVVAKHKERYHINDPTFDTEGTFWISQKAIDTEGDGYFLVPEGALPVGWTPVTDEEGREVWGRGEAKGRDESAKTLGAGRKYTCGFGGGGMAKASAFAMQATLNIADTPLGYTPPIGPDMQFLLNYNHLETNQPSTPAYSTFGPDWSFNWVSYLTVDASGNATVRVRGGGSEVFNFVQPDNVSNPFAPDLISQAILTVSGKDSYERQLPDGSIEVFNQPDGTGRIFMTRVIDPQGNSATISYNTRFRVSSITDAIGQVTTLSYLSNNVNNSGYYKISGISDPFSRAASFTFDDNDVHVVTITDVINLKSNFVYDPSSSFILTMTTPYGVTAFEKYTPPLNINHNPPADNNLARGLRFTFPDQTAIVLENWLNFEQKTYYWDRHACELYPGDPGSNIYDHCETTQWQMIDSAPILESAVVDWVKAPLESRVTYTYPGQIDHGQLHYTGTSNKPLTISRPIEGGITQTSTFEYNAFGQMTKSVDSLQTGNPLQPDGRVFQYFYAANNVDLLEIRETKDGNNFLLGKWQYNSQHLPLVYIDGSGQKTQYSYNSQGQLTTLTDADNKVTTYGYTNNYRTSIDGPLTGDKDKTTISYDGYGRIYRVTNSEGYVLEYQYDSADRTTKNVYLDGTFEEFKYDRLDQIASKDRIGRWSVSEYDSMEQLARTVDPLGRKIEYTWCSCGSPVTLKDGAGNTTKWHHDLQGRTVQKEFANGTVVNFEYEPTTTSGRLKRRIDARGQKTDYRYNTDDTLKSIEYSDLAVANSTSNVNLTWDGHYRRIATVQNGWGALTYAHNNYISNPYGTPTTGGGMLDTVTNNVIANSGIDYFYDSLGRTTKREINGASNRITWAYDAMSRVTSEINALGTFNYTYVDQSAPGGDRGTTRLASIGYPNSQVTNFSYFGNIGDQRLQRISNLNPSGGILSEFDYGYDSSGQITQWHQTQNADKLCYNLGYDNAGQLTRAQAGSGSPLAPFGREYYYGYDSAANRTSVQTSTLDNLQIGGTKTTGDVLTVTVFDPALTGGQKAINYTVQSGDGMLTIPMRLAAAITADTSLQAIGVNAQSTGGAIGIRSVSPNITRYSTSTSVGATETMTFVIRQNGIQNAIIGGTPTAADILTITIKQANLPGGQQSVSYQVQPADTLITIATGLKNAVAANSNLSSQLITATSGSSGSLGVVSIKSNRQVVTSYAQSTSSGATETILLSINNNPRYLAVIGGTATVNDVVTLRVFDVGLPGGTQSVSRTIVGGDTPSSIATALTGSINANANLQAAQITATSSGSIITFESKSPNITNYRRSITGAGTETVSIMPQNFSIQTITIGGTKTTGNVVTITVFNSSLPGGQKSINYTVQSGDTLETIAAGLAGAISGDSDMNAIGVSTVGVSPPTNVVNLVLNTLDKTTLTKSTSTGATATVTLGPSVGATGATFNNVNELTTLSPGGAANFRGSTTKPVKTGSIKTTLLSILASSPNSTTYSQSTSPGGATETITLGVNSGGNTTASIGGSKTTNDVLTITVIDSRLPGGQKAINYTVQSSDTLVTIAAGLATAFGADSNLQSIGITATNSTPTDFEWSQNLNATARLGSGANTAAVSVTDGASNTKTNTYQIPVTNSAGQTNLTYDANGNMTSDGTNSYVWDAENRLIEITYPGTGNNSQMTYDGLDRCVKIIEQSGGSTTSTKQFVWCGDARCEERDGSGVLTKQFFKGGQRNSSTNYFYCKDFPGSNREMTDSSGNIQAQYGFDPYGRTTKLQGSQSADFQFAGYYTHLPSALNMTLFRSYNANLGRWLSRDPVGQMDSTNFYSYVDNAPVLGKDSLGLYTDPSGKSCLGYACGAGYAIPDPGDSLSATMGKLGFSCKKVSSYKKCCCPGGFMFYIMRSNLPNPWTDPWPSGDSYYNEYHSVRHTGVDGGSGWSEMPYAWHPDEQPPFPGVKLPPEPFAQPVSNPDEAGHPMGKHKYCCCPKKKK